MSTTAMAVTDPNQSLALNYGFNARNFPKPSYVDLIQPINALDGLVAGQFRDKESNMQFESTQIVVLEIADTRVLFPIGSERGAAPLCKSYDGIMPVLNNPELVPQSRAGCAKCEHASWANFDKKTHTGIPPCKEQKRMLYIDRDTGLPYRFTAQKMALAPVKSLDTTLYKLHLISQGNHKKNPQSPIIPIFGFTVKMTSEKKVGKKGTFFVPKFGAPQRIEDVSEFGPIYEALVINRQHAADMEADEAVSEAVEGQYVDA